MKITFRILAFPFFAGFSFIWMIMLWIKWMINFLKYGGEAIAYTDKYRSTTILDVFQKLQEQQETNKQK